jgi:hypothetical protein
VKIVFFFSLQIRNLNLKSLDRTGILINNSWVSTYYLWKLLSLRCFQDQGTVDAQSIKRSEMTSI